MVQGFAESLQHIDEVTSKYGSQCSKGLPIINVYLATALHRQGCISKCISMFKVEGSVAKILQNPVCVHALLAVQTTFMFVVLHVLYMYMYVYTYIVKLCHVFTSRK